MSSDSYAAFLAALSPEIRASSPETVELERRLKRLWERAQAEWPQLSVTPAELYSFIGARLHEIDRLDELPAGDLYLACAWLAGAAGAAEALEAGPFTEAARMLSRFNAPPHLVEEAKQATRSRLHARTDGTAALASYAGHGPLRSWLSILMARELLPLLREHGQVAEARSDDAAAFDEQADDDPETAYLRAFYSDHFRRAFTDALTAADAPDKRLLRYHLVERLSIDEVAALSGLHRSTAARQITAARRTLLDRVKRLLKERLHIDSDELQSLQKLVENNFEVSVQRILTEPR